MTDRGDGRPSILQVLPSLETGGGGVERSTLDIAAALARCDARALVASAGGNQVRELQRVGARHVAVPLKSRSPIAIYRNVGRLVDIIRSCDVDLVHARSRAPAWSALVAARRTGRPFATTFHGYYSGKGMAKRFYNSVMARGDLVIANSRFIAGHIRKTWPGAVAPVVIPRGIDLDIFSANAVTSSRIVHLAKTWSLPDGLPVVMLPGRLTRWKGQMLLVDALARLREMDFASVLAGAPVRDSYRREVENHIRARGLGGRVRLTGHCADMSAAYMLADIVVSASTQPEAFGRVVVEAQAMGRIAVAPAHGAALEQIDDGVTGFLYSPGDADALARAVRRALSLSPADRRRIAGAGVALARRRYSRETMCDATLAAYDRLLGAAGHAAPAGPAPSAGDR